MGFRDWLSKTMPDGTGGNWGNRSDADLDYGRFARSKRHNASGQVELDPEKMYLGITKKPTKTVNIDNTNLGDENVIFNPRSS